MAPTPTLAEVPKIPNLTISHLSTLSLSNSHFLFCFSNYIITKFIRISPKTLCLCGFYYHSKQISCFTNQISCPSNYFTCVSKLLSCPGKIFTCAGELLTCPSNLFTEPGNIFTCDRIFTGQEICLPR